MYFFSNFFNSTSILTSPIFLLTIIIFYSERIKSIESTLKIELGNEVIYWTECILRKTLIPVNEIDPCYMCTMDPSLGETIEIQGWNQPYINCSNSCEFITICSEAKYYTALENRKEPTLIPVCYQCENRKTEEVYFQLIREDELCSSQCADCAGVHDILTATECARKCMGLPTFCYPIERWFNNRKCYRATFWYGCEYAEVSNSSEIFSTCKECARSAQTLNDAQECAIECDGLPTYSTRAIEDGKEREVIAQCVEKPPAGPGDFFYYEIPQAIVRYLHVSNPGNIYPAASLGTSYLSSDMGKQIFRKFNMSLLTWPLPKGYEKIKLI